MRFSAAYLLALTRTLPHDAMVVLGPEGLIITIPAHGISTPKETVTTHTTSTIQPSWQTTAQSMRNSGISVKFIAKKLNKHPSQIYKATKPRGKGK